MSVRDGAAAAEKSAKWTRQVGLGFMAFPYLVAFALLVGAWVHPVASGGITALGIMALPVLALGWHVVVVKHPDQPGRWATPLVCCAVAGLLPLAALIAWWGHLLGVEVTAGGWVAICGAAVVGAFVVPVLALKALGRLVEAGQAGLTTSDLVGSDLEAVFPFRGSATTSLLVGERGITVYRAFQERTQVLWEWPLHSLDGAQRVDVPSRVRSGGRDGGAWSVKPGPAVRVLVAGEEWLVPTRRADFAAELLDALVRRRREAGEHPGWTP